MKSRYPLILIAVIFVFCMTTFLASMVDARRGGGGGRGSGGFSRGGPAANGRFSSRPASQAPRRETRQERRDERREDRQDFIDDELDDDNDHYHHSGGVAFLTYVPCSTTVLIDGSTYYHCSSTWYLRGYEGGDVVYIVTSAPAGY